jgi:membrane-bound metal-dependent hydrolase YbcI (DUF457 family)
MTIIEIMAWWLQPSNTPLLWLVVFITTFLTLLVGVITWRGVDYFFNWMDRKKK